jgi:hypothetical protein
VLKVNGLRTEAVRSLECYGRALNDTGGEVAEIRLPRIFVLSMLPIKAIICLTIDDAWAKLARRTGVAR